jgi:alkanesulfonate monooxygenase SsuD/methylene tetrahydromethanopterin reductase-like flavin-dependent oxidoreductase (luciferase family)
MDGLWSEPERFHVERMTRCSAVGSPESVRRQLAAIAVETGADELILATQAYDHAARLRSFEIAAGHRRPTGNERPAASAPDTFKAPARESPTAPAV